MSVLEEGGVPSIHEPFVAGNERAAVSSSRSLSGSASVHYNEATSACDARNNSPAVRTVPRFASTTKNEVVLEDKMGNDECR